VEAARTTPRAAVPEALILRVIGGWEDLRGVVNFTRFHVAGYDVGPLQKEELAIEAAPAPMPGRASPPE
jgi:hypothetical protein